MNFYLSAVDTLVKQDDDKPTIGILLCRDKNNFETEFALRDINKPMGVSEFELTEILPDYIFQFVSKVYFHIGAKNIRSQIAITRLGAEKIAEQEVTYFGEDSNLNYVYEITKTS